MAIVSFDEIHKGRASSDEVRKDSGTRRYTRAWQIRTNANTDDATTIYAHGSCPKLGDAHPNDASAYCRRRRARNEEFSKIVWKLTCEYSTGSELDDNPLDDPAEISWETDSRQRAFWKDRDGNAILNSAGDYYDPPIQGDDSRWTATVKKNVAAVPAWLLNYRDVTNSDQFTLDGLTIAVGEAKMSRIRISKWQERNEIAYRVLTMTIALNGDGWEKDVLDQGFRERDPCATSCGSAGSGSASGSGSGACDVGRRHILDANCDPVVSPVPLDGNGCAIACPTPENAVFRTHHIYKTKAFSSLPLS